MAKNIFVFSLRCAESVSFVKLYSADEDYCFRIVQVVSTETSCSEIKVPNKDLRST
jgi:hypothetical protein